MMQAQIKHFDPERQVLSVEAAQLLDQCSSQQFHLPSLLLMEHAGKAVADRIYRDYPLGIEQRNRSGILIIAGSGNNGADALVAARWLHHFHYKPYVFIVTSSSQPAKSNRELEQQRLCLEALGVSCERYVPGKILALESILCVVDGLFGIGFKGELDGPFKSSLEEAGQIAKRDKARVFAIDVPSGLNPDSGHPQNIVLSADVTLTFGSYKLAHKLAPARDFCGEVVLCDIGFPNIAADQVLAKYQARFELVGENYYQQVPDQWKSLSPSCHKYDRGHVLVIGGSKGKTGAPLMSALAALRCGAGWASVALTPECRKDSEHYFVPPELTFEDLFVDESLQINVSKFDAFLKARHVRAVILGPGMMELPWATYGSELLQVLRGFSQDQSGFVLIDAGALAGFGDYLKTHLKGQGLDPEKWLLTPHPGEWLKLFRERGFSPPLDVTRLDAVASQLDEWGINILYKHATPVLIQPRSLADSAAIFVGGSSIQAKAGSGDVLAGVIGAHGAIGYSAGIACLRAQSLVAASARHAARELGTQSVVASDLIAYLGMGSNE